MYAQRDLALWLVVAAACHRDPAAATDSGATRFDASIRDGLVPDIGTLDDASDALPDAAPPDAPVDGLPVGTPESTRLGMNDISFLLQLPADPTNTTTFVRMTGFMANGDLIPRNLYTQMIQVAPEIVTPFEAYHVVAFRFDACDRSTLGACAVGADGQLRLTFQPLIASAPTTAADIALHASYRVPAVDMPYVVNELRALARLRGLSDAAPLQVNELLSATAAPSEYATRLRTLVAAFARQSRLIRLTVFAQPANLSPFLWHFSGLEPVNGSFQYVPIPGVNISWVQQEVALNGVASFNESPIADIPAHFTVGMDQDAFAVLTPTEQRQSLEALTSVLNPTTTSITTVSCGNCHLATFLTEARASEAHVQVTNIAGRFTSAHDLSIAAGQSATDGTSLRMFGWRDNVAEISQRVANETAMALDELEARFPAPP